LQAPATKPCSVQPFPLRTLSANPHLHHPWKRIGLRE
jgi:hypothetical protein